MRVLVTGGLGFIGSAVVRQLTKDPRYKVLNIDKVSYASTFGSVEEAEALNNYSFQKCDLLDKATLRQVFVDFKPEAIIHLAAESHVDRSIDGPLAFLESNVHGTFNLLELAREFSVEKFVHVSTDEVFGSLGLDDPEFNESSNYSPRSPYSASKAASDHFARAWAETFEVPVVVTNCSNNYGPYQFPEKLIPVTLIKATRGEELPVYGNGENIRDWLYVEDHANALVLAMESGVVGETYLIGGNNERQNIELVRSLCKIVDDVNAQGRIELPFSHPCSELITFVADRPGHDHRYAIDSSKIQAELGWKPEVDIDTGLAMTANWYIENKAWWQPLVAQKESMDRIGTAAKS